MRESRELRELYLRLCEAEAGGDIGFIERLFSRQAGTLAIGKANGGSSRPMNPWGSRTRPWWAVSCQRSGPDALSRPRRAPILQ
jgi:hypothetical protein